MHLRTVVLLALVAVFAAACAHRPPVVAGAEREELQRRESGFLAALGARDAERTAAYFAEDGVLHVAGMPTLRGRGAIRQFYGNVVRFLSASASTPEAVRVGSGADMAYSTGRVTNVFAGEQGPVEYAGKYLLVWERRGGEWSIAAYSVSSDRPETSR
jgi:uncharacterized protein (TIGR02246 family)